MEKKKRLIITAAMAILPLLLCILYCAAYGKTLADIYLPNSYWNDELFYYKQVEGILKNGVPGGYFGFNESQAQVLSFAVWSPLLMIPWVVWGALFRWNFFAPVLCNLLCLAAGMGIFARLARPNIRQALSLTILFSLFTPLTRFVMSCMPETFCCSLLLWYMGCLFAWERERRKKFLWQMYGIAGFLTLMRPYFLLFLFYPIAALPGRRKTKYLAAGGGTLFALTYLILKKFLSADYLYNIMEIDFLKSFQENGLSAGITAFFQQITEGISGLKNFLRSALSYGNFPGSMYAVFGLIGVLFLIVAAAEYKNRKERFYFRLSLSAAIVYAAMMAAIVFIYSLNEGGRHLMTFILAGISILGMYSAKITDKLVQLFLTIIIGFFFLLQPGIPYDRLVPFREETLSEEIEALSRQLQESMIYTSEISWENTVIWLSYDIVGEETVSAEWQQLYALPGGCGINFCPQPYVLEHIDSLKARYIAAIPGGQVEKALLERGAVSLGGNDKIVILQYDTSVIERKN